jgi:hypothetical protein
MALEKRMQVSGSAKSAHIFNRKNCLRSWMNRISSKVEYPAPVSIPYVRVPITTASSQSWIARAMTLAMSPPGATSQRNVLTPAASSASFSTVASAIASPKRSEMNTWWGGAAAGAGAEVAPASGDGD